MPLLISLPRSTELLYCFTLLNMLYVDPKEKTILVEVEGSPSMAATHLAIMGSKLESEGSHEAAETFFRNAIAINSHPGGSSAVMARLMADHGLILVNMGSLDKAEGELKQALDLYATLPSGERVLGRIALARECLAQLYEAKNLPDLAIRTRAGGMASGEMRCSSRQCCKPPLTTDELNRCARCLSSWYCGRACQQADWDVRHKAQCKHLRDAKTQASK